MENPKIIGRDDEGGAGLQQDIRADTVPVHTVTLPYPSSVAGEVKVSVFRSLEDADRGGYVFRITVASDNMPLWQPFAKHIPSGVELHMAGDHEARQVIDALKTALATL